MKVDVSNLSDGIHEYSLSAEPADIGLSAEFRDTVRVALTLDKSNRQIHLRARVESIGSFRCDRCVDEFMQEVGNEYEMFYTSEGSDRARYEGDEVHLVTPDFREIEIGEDVRQFLMLAIPQKLLCKESCLGLCPRCGRNRNRERCACSVEEIDSRWDKLRGLLNYQ